MNHSDWVVVGRFGRVHGIQGYISVISFTEPRDNLLDYRHWHIDKKNQWQPITIQQPLCQAKAILVRVDGYADRETVAQLTNCDIAVPRDELPALAPNEYYWHELIGMQVIDTAQKTLGTVSEIMATGSNDVLVVVGDKRHLIPYLLDTVVLNIDDVKQQITVDWDPDF